MCLYSKIPCGWNINCELSFDSYCLRFKQDLFGNFQSEIWLVKFRIMMWGIWVTPAIVGMCLYFRWAYWSQNLTVWIVSSMTVKDVKPVCLSLPIWQMHRILTGLCVSHVTFSWDTGKNKEFCTELWPESSKSLLHTQCPASCSSSTL